MFVRRWVAVASTALVLGALASDETSGPRLLVTWSQRDPAKLALIVPISLALIAFPLSRCRHSAVQGAVLTLAPLAAFGIYVVAAMRSYHSFPGSLVLLIQIVLGSALVASSNHVLRRHWERRTPRVLSAIGGLTLLLAFLIKRHESYQDPLLWEVVREGLFGRALAASFFAILVLCFGILGVLNAIAGPPAWLHRRLVSLFGYLLLGGFPPALLVHSSTGREYEDAAGPFLLRFWLLATGHTVLLATGIAAWVEALTDSPPPETEIGAIL